MLTGRPARRLAGTPRRDNASCCSTPAAGSTSRAAPSASSEQEEGLDAVLRDRRHRVHRRLRRSRPAARRARRHDLRYRAAVRVPGRHPRRRDTRRHGGPWRRDRHAPAAPRDAAGRPAAGRAPGFAAEHRERGEPAARREGEPRGRDPHLRGRPRRGSREGRLGELDRGSRARCARARRHHPQRRPARADEPLRRLEELPRARRRDLRARPRAQRHSGCASPSSTATASPTPSSAAAASSTSPS